MERKIRYSRQRERIYEYLCSTKEHPSADMIYEDLRGEIKNLSLGTVYRNLRLLEDMGKVQRVTTLQNVERYDAKCEDHAHFACQVCGRVTDLSSVNRAAAQKACGVDEGVRVYSVNLTFKGVCEDCLSAGKTAQNNIIQ
ncbi:MAG: transcriptional repressor [Clostridia bacterium]|nr:transcriptional repressor [Clostridia bacterium]